MRRCKELYQDLSRTPNAEWGAMTNISPASL
jgi:hypothetical protein